MRFMSNGYPEAWIDEVDYDSTRAVGDKSEVDAQIDAKIAALKQRTGKSQGRRRRALARHHRHVRLPHQRGDGRAAAGQRRAAT